LSIETKVVFAFIDGDFKDRQWGPGIFNWRNDIDAGKTIFESKVEPYPDNPRQVKVFEAIDAAGMSQDFWQALDAAIVRP